MLAKHYAPGDHKDRSATNNGYPSKKYNIPWIKTVQKIMHIVL